MACNHHNNNNNNADKLKQESYHNLCMSHEEALTAFYDHYMDFSPGSVRQIFALMFELNKLLRLLLIYCLLYHTVWWLPNSTSHNSAINFSLIDPVIFVVLIYLNFYHLLVNRFLIQLICSKLALIRPFLAVIEAAVYVLINLSIACYLKYYLTYSIKFIIMFMLPHLACLVYNNFSLNLTLLSCKIIDTDEPLLLNLATADMTDNEEEDKQQRDSELANTTASFTYTDCSNMSMATFFNQSLAMPNLTSGLAKAALRQNSNRAKPNRTTRRYDLFYNSCISFLNHCVQTSSFTFSKHNLFTSDCTMQIKHKCQRNANNLRAETFYLKHEFNKRLKLTTLHTFESIYFTFVTARLFVPANLYIREKDYFFYFGFALISTFISYWLYYMPLSLLMSFNRNAQHLGIWCVTNGQQSAPDRWLNYKCYMLGDSVTYMNRTYKAGSPYCVSIPDDQFHKKFYRLFAEPLRVLSVVLLFKLVGFFFMCIFAFTNRKWYAIVINIMEVLGNSHIFFVLFRDFFLLYCKRDLLVDIKKLN